MTKKDKIEYILKALEEKYPRPTIPLDHSDPYTLLIAVLLSAQCTDARVNLVTPHLFRLANNPAEMAKLTARQIEDIIRPCGLGPAKSKNILELSRILIRDYQGVVPDSLAIGDKEPPPPITLPNC